MLLLVCISFADLSRNEITCIFEGRNSQTSLLSSHMLVAQMFPHISDKLLLGVSLSPDSFIATALVLVVVCTCGGMH